MDAMLPGLLRGFGVVLENSWQASVLVLLVLGVQRLLGRVLTPGWRHALWWIVIGRLLLPVTPPSAWSLFNLLPGRFAAKAVRHDSSASMQKAATPSGPAPIPLEGPTRLTPWSSTAAAVGPIVPVVLESPRAVRLGDVLAGVWAAGALWGLGRWLTRSWHFSRRLASSTAPVGPEWVALLDECRLRVGVRRRVDLVQGDGIVAPAVCGWFRTRLLLPRRLVASASRERLRHIFLHELAHVRRGDLAVLGLTGILGAIHWFNPVLAWAFRRLCVDRELAADALALAHAGEGEGRAYGLTIVALLEDWAIRASPPGAVGIVENPASLERRIQAIADYRRPSRWTGATAVLLVVLAAVSWTSAETGSPKPDQAVTNAEGPSVKPPVGEGVRPVMTADLAVDDRAESDAAERRRLLQLMESVRFPEIGFDTMPLGDAVRRLRELVDGRVAAGQGIRFLINPYLDAARPGESGPVIDPVSGEPLAGGGSGLVRLSEVKVRIAPPLRDVSLGRVLVELTRSAESPMRFVVEDHGVVFTHLPPRDAMLATRLFPVNAVRWTNGLMSSAGVDANDASNIGLINQYLARISRLEELERRHSAESGELLEATRAEVAAWRARLTDGVVVHPVPPAPPEPPAVNQLLVFRGGLWWLNGRIVVEPERAERLRDLATDPGVSGRTLQVWLEPSLPMVEAVQVLDLAKAAGVQNLVVSEQPAERGNGFHLVPWRGAAELPPRPQAGSVPVLVAFHAEWALSGQLDLQLLQSFRVQRLFQSTRTELYRVDCTRERQVSKDLQAAYGVPHVPGYAVFRPDSGAWSVVESPLTEARLSALLKSP